MNSFVSAHYNLHGLLNLASGVFNISVGIVILADNPRSPLNRSLFWITLASLFWVTGLGVLSLADSKTVQNAAIVVVYLGVPFLSPTVYRFSECLLVRFRWTALSIAGHVVALILAAVMAVDHERIVRIASFSWGRFVTVQPTWWGYVYYGVFMTAFAFFGFCAVRILWRVGGTANRRVCAGIQEMSWWDS